MILAAAATLLLGPSTCRLVSVPLDVKSPKPGESRVQTVKDLRPGIEFTEIVPSWNLQGGSGRIRVEVRSPVTGWFDFGTWSRLRAQRGSVKMGKQKGGAMMTDTLRFSEPTESVDVRVTLTADADASLNLSLLTLSFRNGKDDAPEGPPVASDVWGRTVDVPQVAQGDYPRGNVLCSPTSLSMVLRHWSAQRGRSEWFRDVPEVEENVWDPIYDGAGNWSYNAAYAGSLPGLRALVSRFESISDLEPWIRAGLPVICSVDLDRLRERPSPNGSGHLIVVVGFDEKGDIIANDPATRAQIRRTYRRELFDPAWRYSGRTVYLVWPEDQALPEDPKRLWTP